MSTVGIAAYIPTFAKSLSWKLQIGGVDKRSASPKSFGILEITGCFNQIKGATTCVGCCQRKEAHPTRKTEFDPLLSFRYGFKLPDTGHWQSSTIAPKMRMDDSSKKWLVLSFLFATQHALRQQMLGWNSINPTYAATPITNQKLMPQRKIIFLMSWWAGNITNR